MSARQDLPRLLQQWKGLSEAEAQAIQHDDWVLLARHQQAKSQLQAAITAAREQFRTEPPPSIASVEDLPAALRPLLDELVRLEKANQRTLAARLSQTREELATLNAKVRCLRQVQRSYSTRSPSMWHSYS